ncbi:hypothetical protein DVS77_09410 [Mycolicibacterium moriokaense]|nr:hypothetical protein DVS77_09410 [Mycolicibacterium moriokaense]
MGSIVESAVHASLSSTARSPVFTATVAPYLLLDDELIIRGANDAYLEATRRERDDLVGWYMFDAFPDNPGDPGASGVRNLAASMTSVLCRNVGHTMPIQRYDVAPTHSSVFIPKTWSPVNSPVADDRGRVVGLLHHVEDVTPVQSILRLYPPLAGGRECMQPQFRNVHERALAISAMHYQRRRDALAKENLRLRDALVAMAASRGADVEAVERRRRLWRIVADSAGDRRWAGWANALCATAAFMLGTVDGAAISVRATAGHLEPIAASGRWAHEVARLEKAASDGPAHDALDARIVMHGADLSVERERWPHYCSAVAEAGLAAVSAFPLFIDNVDLGTFSVYRRHAHDAAEAEAADAAILGDMALSSLLADHHRVESQTISDGGPGTHDVAVAAGILCLERDLSFDEAISRLRGYAYAVGREIRAVARDVVDRRIRVV